jgi:hypothetical protein
MKTLPRRGVSMVHDDPGDFMIDERQPQGVSAIVKDDTSADPAIMGVSRGRWFLAWARRDDRDLGHVPFRVQRLVLPEIFYDGADIVAEAGRISPAARTDLFNDRVKPTFLHLRSPFPAEPVPVV